MSARLFKAFLPIIIIISFCLVSKIQGQAAGKKAYINAHWGEVSIAKTLGWVPNNENECGGYYLEAPFVYPAFVEKDNLVEIIGRKGIASLKGTSTLDDAIIYRADQQITADKAYVYRDDRSHKLKEIKLVGNVHLREPNTLIVGDEGWYWLANRRKLFTHIRYRTALSGKQIAGPKQVSPQARRKERKITLLTAWGTATQFTQDKPLTYQFQNASFTTCPPIHPAWRIKAKHIVLDKNNGRGYATHARLLVNNVPVLYTPYINFPIDRKRKSGFLWPTLGLSSAKWGQYLLLPYYWNMAPNYDMTITPGLLSKRGLQISDYFRYLSTTSRGFLHLSIDPYDPAFKTYQNEMTEKYQNNSNPVYQSELNRLLTASTARKGFWWRDDSRFNDHWSSHIDFNYASDDYYLRDFGNSLNEITQDQLLQQAEIYYKGENWNFIGRLHGYQTLHPIEEAFVANQYRRLPQLILDGDYTDLPLGLEFFINNEITHFDILKDPGFTVSKRTGNRLHAQPGVSLPFYTPYFYINPRFQLALSKYNLYQPTNSHLPTNLKRSVPIFDLLTAVALYRKFSFFGSQFKQTLEPQAYYTYIPFRDQSAIPVFDTTVNTLTYDQIFNYNRFSGIDRIGDTNQVGVGITSSLIDDETGLEKARLAVGEIFYFTDRKVTLCNDDSCSDNPTNPSNRQKLSPLSATLAYYLNPEWKLSSSALLNPLTQQLGNAAIALQYAKGPEQIVNFGFNYARTGDIMSGVSSTSSQDNLKTTDFSFAWPAFSNISVVGKWTQNWNRGHLLNLLYGVQYDTCCWAVRLVGGKAFLGLDPTTQQLSYDRQFYVQFSLKGLGNIGSGDPKTLLQSITGYNPQFGQVF